MMRVAGEAGWVIGSMSAAVSSRAAATVLAAAAVHGVLGVLAEWQRRRTFATLIAGAPEGTVVVQRDGPGGRTMEVTLGGRPRRRRSAGAGE